MTQTQTVPAKASRSQQKRVEAQKKKEAPPAPPPPPLQETPPAPTGGSIQVNVDWQYLPLQIARGLYALLTREYENAGRILNARATQDQVQWRCFMAGKPGACVLGKIHTGLPRFTDLAYRAPKGGYKDPLTDQFTPEGLSVRVDICSELCYYRYQEQTIAERRERLRPDVNG